MPAARGPSARRSDTSVAAPAEPPPTPRRGHAPGLLDGAPLDARLQWYAPPSREHSRRELLADRCVNFAGAALAWAGALCICYYSRAAGDSAAKQAGFWVYSAGLVVMQSCSAVYHQWSWDWRRAPLLKSLDHTGITAMIAGCWAPPALQSGCYGALAFVWALGAAGLLAEGWRVATGHEPGARTLLDRVNLVRYVLMGWAAVPVLPTFCALLPARAASCILLGGILYTIGIPFFLSANREFSLATWHAFVLAASLCYQYGYMSMVGVTPEL